MFKDLPLPLSRFGTLLHNLNDTCFLQKRRGQLYNVGRSQIAIKNNSHELALFFYLLLERVIFFVCQIICSPPFDGSNEKISLLNKINLTHKR